MANKYLNLLGTDFINDYPPRISGAFDTVEADIGAITASGSNALIGVYSLAVTGTNVLLGNFAGVTYFAGLKLNLTIENDNTAGVTVNINSLGVKNIYKVVKGVKVALLVRDLRVGEIATVEYDGTDFILLNGEREAEYSTEEETFADITSLSSTAKGNMEKCVLEGQTATNLIVNGDFAGGATGWSASNLTVNSVTNGIANVTATAQNGRYDNTIGNRINNYKYLVTGRWKTSSVNTRLSSQSASMGAATAHSGSGQFEIINFVFTAPSDNSSWRVGIMDISTSDWTPIEIDYIRIIKMTGTDFEDYTEAQTLERFPIFFDGTKSVDKVRVLNVGKNLVSLNFEKGRLSETTGLVTGAVDVQSLIVDGNKGEISFTTTANFRGISSIFIPVIANIPITIKIVDIAGLPLISRYIEYSTSRTFVKGEIITETTITRTPTQDGYIKFGVHLNSAGSATIGNIQVEYGSTATTYEPYKPTQAVCPLPLRDVPVVKDTFDAIEGTHRQNVSAPQNIATTVYASIDLATYTNVDVVKTTAFAVAVAGTTAKDSRTRVYNKDGVELEEVAQADIDLVASVGKYYYHTDKTIWFIVANALYADIAGARTGLGTSIAKLQLATPVITNFPSRVLGAEASGTMYNEPFVEDWAFFDSGLALTDNTKLITNLVEVRKWDIETGSYVIIPLSTVTRTNGVITAITGAVTGEFYTFDYNYSTTLSLNAGITYSHPVNAMGQIDVNTKSVVAIDRKTADMEKVIENLLARIETLETP